MEHRFAFNTLILHSWSSYEVRACLAAATTMAAPALRVVRRAAEALSQDVDDLAAGAAVPVGSVEFVREAMKLAGISEPDNLSYPVQLQKYLAGSVRQLRAGSVLGRHFVKPLRTKLFTGFVFDSMQDPAELGEHDREQHAAFMALPPDEMVWVAEPVSFAGEWRYYVRDGRVIGRGRYDPGGADDVGEPRAAVVERVLADLPFEHPCALDFGVLDDGRTVLVEVNDAWAIGLYAEAMPAAEYLDYLLDRWHWLVLAGKRGGRHG